MVAAQHQHTGTIRGRPARRGDLAARGPRLRTEEPHALSRKHFNDTFIPSLHVVDVFRHLHPAERKYTWFNRLAPPGKLDAARVDLALVSETLLPSVVEADILDRREDRHTSDHAPLFLRLRR